MAPETLAVAVAGAVVAAMTVDNVRSMRLRDHYTLGGSALVAVVLLVACAVDGDLAPSWQGLAGGAGMFALAFCAALAWPAGVGFGTVKACLVVGLAAGSLGRAAWVAATVAAVVAFALTIAWSALRRSRAAPSGPALAVAYVAALVAG